MRNPVLLLIALLLPLFSGCKELNSLQLVQDQPEDLQQLLEQNNFARARQLTGKYPAIDSPELQARISTQETAHEDSIITRARDLESDDKLLAAVQLLSNALQKIPNSEVLREYRNRLEKERLEKLRANEIRQLMAQAEYILYQKNLYEQQHNLQSPNMIQRWENTRNDRESETLAKQLRDQGEHAYKRADLKIALECLQLSKSLDNTPETREMLNKLVATKDSQQKVAQKQASLNKAKKRKRLIKDQAKETRKLMETTRQALLVDNLSLAHEIFNQIPSPANESSEVSALREELDRAVDTRVAQLTSRGDSEYRADNVDTAMKTWLEALQLDPENQNLKERLERAGRVLARLEQLKQQQGK
jgi:hypothetical protein